ncbi:MAG: ABC transporter permease subunit [Acidiphilium sp.]|nr:ABC transporter permease subunit [Acidiphilium sp.]MDD4936726.1 ABC transporter permease subunit [Acidiphilium sp.]
MTRTTIVRLVLLGLILFLFVYPLVRLLLLPVLMPVLASSHQSGGWHAVADSLALALVTATIAAPLGALLAAFVTTRSGPVALITAIMLWVLFLAPSYVLTTGWMVVFDTPSWRASLLGQAFFGPAGLILLYIVKALPFSAFVARATIGGAGAALGEAALVHALPRTRRIGIALRLLAPALVTGFAVAVIETMQEFGIPATLGTATHLPILTYAIYQRLAETPTDFAGAAILCWRLIAIAGVLAVASLAVQRRNAALRTGRARAPVRRPPHRAEAIGVGLITAGLGAIGAAIPIVALMTRALSGGWLATPDLGAVLRSLGFGLVGATLAMTVAIVLLKLRDGGARRVTAAIDAALIANLAVPGLVLGAGYIVAFNNRWLPLYGTTGLLIIAYAAGMIPIALRMVQGAFGDLDRNLGAAARLHGLSRATRAIDIEAALLAEPLTYGFLMVCGAIMFELPISELLYPPGETPLGVAIVTLDQMSDFAAAARLALLGLAAMAILAVLLLGAIRFIAVPRKMAAA